MRVFDKNRPLRQQRGAQKGDWSEFNHPSLHYKKPKQLRRFQLVISTLASAALVFGLWSFAWYAMSAMVKAEVIGWVEDQRTLGAIVDFTEMKTTGFPSRIILTLTEPRYDGPAFGDTIEWRADALTVTARPWTPWRLNVDAPGKHKLLMGGGTISLSGVAESLNGDVVLGDVWPEELDLQVQGLSMNGSAPLSADRFNIAFRHDPSTQAGGAGVRLHLQGDNLIIPGGLPQPLGERVQTIDMVARVTGSVIPGPLAQRLPEWRSSGGAIDIERLKFRGGPLGLAAAGALALDKDMQPEGAFTAKIEGLFQVMEILRAKGLMRDSDAVLATMALSALSKRSKNGGASSINLSVTVQDGELSLGPLKVMDMPLFDWGIPAAPAMPATPEPEPAPPPRDYKNIKPVY